jgi:hypothetical protein
MHHDPDRSCPATSYVDGGVPMLLAMHKKRLKGYKDIGYSVIDEAQR